MTLHSIHWSTHSYCKKMKSQQSFLKGLGLADSSQDYESFHFFENEISEDFYNAPAPSEDIWKKFELIPTPPRSPRRDDDTDSLDMVDGIFSPKSTTERLSMVSEILDNDPITQTQILPEFFTSSSGTNLKSSLIQDCMWSGNLGQENSDEKADEKPTEKKTFSSSLDINANTECVDPSSVFPYPLNDTKKTSLRTQSLGIDTPSESDTDDEDEDEDQEIDVVTVERTIKYCKRKRQSTAQVVPTLKVKSIHSTPKSLTVEAFNKTVHSYSMKRKSYSLPGSPPSSSKKLKRENSLSDFKSLVSKYNRSHAGTDGRSSRSGSDSEECGERRAQHNVLERQRRNDLKYSFFMLRDQVPDLERQERAPKVVILNKAVDHIISLRREHHRLEITRQAELNKREQLQRRLAQLKRTSFS